MTEAFLLPVYDTGDFMFSTREHFLSIYSLGRKKRILKQKHQGQVQPEEKKKTSPPPLQGTQRVSSSSLKCWVKTLRK